ncbi:MAG: ribonuclease H family protein [Tannerella sp.]|jgi:ribonuclease HI|nr:ribonuclease H family protein [Tannerella sp.]
MSKKQKYYVVWHGVSPGIYSDWTSCQLQIKGFKGAIFKSFDTLEEAKDAFAGAPLTPVAKKHSDAVPPYIVESIAVDAACSGNPGDMEYRGVYIETGQEIFHVGPLKQGTNNIGEFLAIVHGLALFHKTGCAMPVYSDSHNAILWVSRKKCNTKLIRTPNNGVIFDLIERAEKWLREHEYPNKILKWETSKWGEIPADFGRK